MATSKNYTFHPGLSQQPPTVANCIPGSTPPLNYCPPEVPELFLKKKMLPLLLRHPQGITVDDLLARFAEENGDYLNYRMFGFKSIEEMIEAIPELYVFRRKISFAWGEDYPFDPPLY